MTKRVNRTGPGMTPNELPKENTSGLRSLLVYGTLKRGCWNHDRFCRGVLKVEEAVVRSRLYELPSGISVLEVPESDILACGTTDPLADVATQACLAAEFAVHTQAPDITGKSVQPASQDPVYGELLTFDDPETRLRAIDRRGLPPGGPGLYRRVLMSVCAKENIVLAWLYAGTTLQGTRVITSGKWFWRASRQAITRISNRKYLKLAVNVQ